MIEYYKVGGCVRDELLGVKSKDIDYAVVAESYEAMRDDLVSKGTIIWQERPEFFAIRGKHPEFGPVDFTLCRKEGFYSDTRHPDSVEIGTIFDDLARRDFTVNAIAKTIDGEYLDPHEGRADLERMYLRCVNDPYERFNEDALRILRAVRFHIVRGFTLDSVINEALQDLEVLNGLEKIPVERAYEELKKCYEHDTWETMMFFQRHRELQWTIFNIMGLRLEPKI